MEIYEFKISTKHHGEPDVLPAETRSGGCIAGFVAVSSSDVLRSLRLQNEHCDFFLSGRSSHSVLGARSLFLLRMATHLETLPRPDLSYRRDCPFRSIPGPDPHQAVGSVHFVPSVP